MNKDKAFTLIELSITILIISLIIGGITAGISVKKRAELMSIMTPITKLQTAYSSFRQIYNALPGDLMSTSTPVFGTSIEGTTILYGGGKGYIDNLLNPDNKYESLIALQHLASAGLINGSFSGNWNSVSNINSYLPSKLVDYYGYYFGNNETNRDTIIFYSKIYDDAGIISVPSDITLASISPADLARIDYKYDDGYPNTGNIIGLKGTDVSTSNGCINSSVTPNIYSNYNVNGCYMRVIISDKIQ